MGVKIGLPSLKLNNAGVKTKNCGDFGSVAREALKEREGHDPDIDQERAELNRFYGFQTAADLQEYSRKHVEQLRDAKGRRLRSDAVVMCATLIKPPAAFMHKLSEEDQIRFLDDAYEILADIIGRDKIKSRADHFDEMGAHTHVFWEPMTDDGRLCAKEVHNLKFFQRVNRDLPKKLREKNWEIEDCEMYDAAKADYEKNKGKNGRSSMTFKADAEKAKQEIEQEVSQLQEQLREGQKALKNTSEKRVLEEAQYKELCRVNEINLGVIAQNDALIQQQEEALDLILDYEQYLDEGDEVDQQLEILEEAESQKPEMQQFAPLFQQLRHFIGLGIRRLQIFERSHQVNQRISEPLQKRADSLDQKISAAEQKKAEDPPRRTGRADADAWRKQVWTIYHESKSVKEGWYADKEARQEARSKAWETKEFYRERYYSRRPKWEQRWDGKWKKIESPYTLAEQEDARRAYERAKNEYGRLKNEAKLPRTAAKTLEAYKAFALALADDPDALPADIERAIDRYRKAMRVLQEPSTAKIRALERELSDLKKSTEIHAQKKQLGEHSIVR